MRLDLGLVCELAADHLDRDGVGASARGRELRLAGGPTFRLRAEGRPDEESPGSLFWADVGGLRLDPPMSLDLSGWGTTPEACAIDAAHGLMSAIVPPVRWLATEPWRPPTGDAGQIVRLEADGEQPWTIVVGRPWVVVATSDPADSTDRISAELRHAITTAPTATLDGLGALLAGVTGEPRGHWFKLFAARFPDGAVSGRVDIDNRESVENVPFATALPWALGSSLQIIRQLVVLRPDGEPPRPEPAGRLRRLLGRA